jgi:hypothetical protein
VNSSGGAHARNARRLVHAARKQDRRLAAALLAAAIGHTPEAEEVLRGARTRMARKPSALARELLRNFPKGRRGRRRRRGKSSGQADASRQATATNGAQAQEKSDEEPVEPEPDAAEEIERAAAELNGARNAEEEVAELFAEQQELGEGDLEGYSVDE